MAGSAVHSIVEASLLVGVTVIHGNRHSKVCSLYSLGSRRTNAIQDCIQMQETLVSWVVLPKEAPGVAVSVCPVY